MKNRWKLKSAAAVGALAILLTGCFNSAGGSMDGMDHSNMNMDGEPSPNSEPSSQGEPPVQTTPVERLTGKEFTLTAKTSNQEIAPGKTLPVWTFNNSVPGPELRVKQGETVKINLKNELPEPVTIHWHGIPVPNDMDGIPGVTQNAVQPGESFTYEFKAEFPGTYWYHSHQDGVNQVDRGLYGSFIVEPNEADQVDRDYTLVLDEWMSTGMDMSDMDNLWRTHAKGPSEIKGGFMNHQPVLSIDVAKGKSVAAAFLSYNECVRKPFTFKHSPAEMTILLELLELLEQTTGVLPHVVLEATGIYSKPIVSFFSDRGYPVVVLNPLYTHQLKTKAVRKVKTDPIDATRIAQAFYLGEGLPHRPLHQQIDELRVLCRQYYQWSDRFGEIHVQFRSMLDLLFPGYDKVFHKVYNPASLELLQSFPTPQQVLSASRNELLQILKQNRRGQAWNEKKLDLLLTIAHESLPDSNAQNAHCIALQSYIHMIRSYRECITNIETQMLTLAESIETYGLLRSIPGVGPITAAVIVGEIGDIKRFPTSKQLTAFAGLDSSVYTTSRANNVDSSWKFGHCFSFLFIKFQVISHNVPVFTNPRGLRRVSAGS